MAKTNPVPIKPKELKLFSWNKFTPLKILKINKRSKAAVVLDKTGRPQLFLFDTFALLDLLSQIDEALVDKLSIEEYHSPTMNPAGSLIDGIEANLPINPKYVASLKAAIKEADKKGWLSLSKVQADLGLA